MRYFKSVENGYIIVIGTGNSGTEITESEYNQIMSVIQNCTKREGYGYKLKTDLTWEEYELPEPETDEIDSDEALSIIFGGADE